MLRWTRSLKARALSFVSTRKKLRAVAKGLLLLSVIGLCIVSMVFVLLSISEEAMALRLKATSVHGLWPSLNPELTLTSIGSAIPATSEPNSTLLVGPEGALATAWQLPHMYYVTRYRFTRCSQKPACSFPNICPEQLEHFSWRVQGQHADSKEWVTLHSANTSSAQPGAGVALSSALQSVTAVRLVVHPPTPQAVGSVCVSQIEIVGKFDVHYNVWVGLTEYWNKTRASSPALRLLVQIVESGKMHLHKGEVDKRSQHVLKACVDQTHTCLENWFSLACFRSLPSSVSVCTQSVRELVSQELEVLSWVNWNQIQSIGSRFILEAVLGGALKLFGTAFGFLWNLFMFLMDLWVFLVVFVGMVFSEEGILPWVLTSFTTFERATIQQITLVCTRDIHGVFVSLAKIAVFHSVFSWFSCSFFDLDFPCTIGVLSGVLCLVDERLVLLCLLPAAVQLWAHTSPSDGYWLALMPVPVELSTVRFWVFCSLNVWRCLGGVGANIFRCNTPDLHPMIVGWSVFGGISLFGASGAITGPMVATLPFMLRELFGLYKEWVSSAAQALSPGHHGLDGDSPLLVPHRMFDQSLNQSQGLPQSDAEAQDQPVLRVAHFRQEDSDSELSPPGARSDSFSHSVFGTPRSHSTRRLSSSLQHGSCASSVDPRDRSASLRHRTPGSQRRAPSPAQGSAAPSGGSASPLPTPLPSRRAASPARMAGPGKFSVWQDPVSSFYDRTETLEQSDLG